MIHVIRAAIARPVLTIVVCLVLAGLGLLYTARALTFQTSAVELLPQDRVYVQRFKHYLRDFGELNDIVIAIEAADVEQAKAFAARLADRLTAAGTRVTYRIDPDAFAGRALLYASATQLGELRDKLREHRTLLEGYAANPTLAALLDGLDKEIARRFAGRFVDLGLDEKPPRLDAAFIDTLLATIHERLAQDAPRPSPWGSLFTDQREARSGYLLSRDNTLLFMLVEPRREAGNFTDNQHVIASIRRTIALLRAEFPGLAAGVTGAPALANDEMVTAFEDSTVASVLSSILVLASVLVLFRRLTKPLIMFVVLMVSLAWSLGLITLTVGHLTVFSVMFISLFVGIGIDYGIYFLFRYEEERGLGQAVRAAVETTAIRTGPGIMYAALSAAGTFGVLMLTDFRGIVEFGFIGGVAIFMAFIAMVTLFPAVLVVLDTRAGAPGGSRPSATALTSRPDVRVLDRLTAHSRTILGVAAVLTALSLWALPMVHFDYNRLNLQAKATESSAWERKIVAAGRSAFPALSSAESLEELRLKRDAFGRLSSVSDVVSVLNVIPEQQAEKIALVRDIAAVVAPVQVSAGGDEDPVRLRAALTTLRRRLELVVHEAGTDASPALRSAAERSQTLLHRLQDVRPNTARRLREIQGELRDDLGTQLRRLQDNLAPQPLTVADLPRELKRKFIGESGAFLVQVYPSVDTWDRSGVAQFVAELRSVDPSVTGSPVISYEAGQMVERAYFEGSLYAIVLIGVLSAVMLRRWSSATLAILPMVASTLWTIGVMRLLGLSFNLANVWALPLIIGASAEYGLNVALRHQEAVVDGGPVLPRSTVMAVLLNGLTTIAGFSSLMIARHQGIFGLGLLLTVGSVAGLTASLIVLPVLLRRLNPVERVPTPGAGVRRTAMISLTVAGVLLVPPAAVGPAMAGEPTEQVRTAVTELYQILTRSPGAADSRQREAAAQVMDRLFDWRTMAQHSLRHHWEARTPAEREQFTRLFADIFRQAYLARISLVDAGKFRYLGDRIVGDRAIVDTRVTTKRGSDIAVVYVTAQDRGPQWRVEDVRVEGISLLDNYRTQFDAIITRSSYEAFVKRLQDRLKQPG